MSEILETILIVLVSSLGTDTLIGIFVFLNVEKVEKWLAVIGYAVGRVFKSVNKKAVQFDLQGCINDYVKMVSKETPTLETQKVKVELVDENTKKSSFLSDGTVILRLRKNDHFDLNFVHGAYLFVSTSLLFRVKRYISQSQREALDLFVTTRIIEKEKSDVMGYFQDEYLHPRLMDTKDPRAIYYNQLSIIDQGGLFNYILLEELHILGSKVFGKRQDDKIISEVDGLVTFLEKVSTRVVGNEEIDLTYKKEYCKSAIMIVGKRAKLVNEEKVPYVKYIRGVLFKEKMETVYILGRLENKDIICGVCEDVSDIYSVLRSRKQNVFSTLKMGLQKPKIVAYLFYSKSELQYTNPLKYHNSYIN
jgi:hypothetical protein